jgi:alkanesulfonate monooxygenase SsuD/methylene tetrahydromethanopterin reductase-like flavin-dependent oxidoreductase (luciferase family)
MKLLGQAPPARPPIVRSAEELPLYEFDFDLTQKEGLTFVGDPDYVAREIRAHMQELGAGVFMGLFQFGSLPLATKDIELFAKTVLPALRRE